MGLPDDAGPSGSFCLASRWSTDRASWRPLVYMALVPYVAFALALVYFDLKERQAEPATVTPPGRPIPAFDDAS